MNETQLVVRLQSQLGVLVVQICLRYRAVLASEIILMVELNFSGRSKRAPVFFKAGLTQLVLRAVYHKA